MEETGYTLVMEEPSRPESAIRPRTWKACCLVPALAIGGVLLIVAGASLFSSRPALRRPSPAVSDTRKDFVQFGKQFFAISQKADVVSENAFKVLQSEIRNKVSIEKVHSAFRRASDANRQASGEFKVLAIPPSLRSQSKLRQSVDTMSRSYYARKLACDILAAWDGNLDDQQTADNYRRQVEDINRLTQEGLSYLADAANDNGITQDDAKRFLPGAIFYEKNPFEAYRIPWTALALFGQDHSLRPDVPVEIEHVHRT